MKTGLETIPQACPKDRCRMVGGEIAPSAANPEPYVRVSPHTAPLCMVIVIDTGLRHL